MYVLIRAILIASLLLQSLPGLAMQRCVAMPSAPSPASMGTPANARCACCGGSDEEANAIGCPLAKGGYAGCNCKNPQPEDPKAPPSDQRSRQIEQLFSALTPVVAILLPEPLPVGVRWTACEPPERSGSHSIQSLLCVWVM